jgi:hypothetical protein
MAYFQTQNPNLGKFGKVLQWKMPVFLWTSSLFHGQMVYFMVILWSFGIFFPVLVCRTEKNLATGLRTKHNRFFVHRYVFGGKIF